MITYRLRGSKKDKTVYIRAKNTTNDFAFSLGKTISFFNSKKSTYWKGGLPTQYDTNTKNLRNYLESLRGFLENEIQDLSSADLVTKNWLKKKIAEFDLKQIDKKLKNAKSDFENKTLKKEKLKLQTVLGIEVKREPKKQPTNVTYWIDHRLNNPTYRNQQNEIKTLSKGRLRHYRNLKDLIEDFEEYMDTTLNVPDLNQSIFDDFLQYLFDEMEMTGQTSAKRASDLKTVCRYAQSKGVKVSDDFNTIAFGSGKTYDNDMDVICLSFDELDKIQRLNLEDERLINARKWLIALCYTGQRGGDLIGNTAKGTKPQLTNSRLKSISGTLVLEVNQEKGNVKVNVPVLPPVKEIFETGLPPQMPLQSVRKYFKELGKLAGIDEPTIGRKIVATEKGKRGVKATRPKYEYLSTHTGRRSFATNFDGEMPRPYVMKITGHSKESTFLKYINKSTDEHIEETLRVFAKLKAKQEKKSDLRMVKGA